MRTDVWVVTALLVIVALACGRPQRVDLVPVPVPEAERRLAFAAPTDMEIARAVELAVCLLRSDDAIECAREPAAAPACNLRSPAELEAAVEPFFAALADIQLDSPHTTSARLAELMPAGVTSTTYVYDARRTASCRDWGADDGPCVAVRVDQLWVLLRAERLRQPVASFEVFTAEPVCAADVRRD